MVLAVLTEANICLDAKTKQYAKSAVLGWSGGAMVLGKLPVPGRPTCLD